MKPGSVVVLNGRNEITAALATQAPSGVTVKHFLTDDTVVADGWILYRGRQVLKLSEILLPGWHNVENYCGVITALQGLVSDETIRKVARTFGGVEHRIELVREKDGVRYYNSSIDSSPKSTRSPRM